MNNFNVVPPQMMFSSTTFMPNSSNNFIQTPHAGMPQMFAPVKPSNLIPFNANPLQPDSVPEPRPEKVAKKEEPAVPTASRNNHLRKAAGSYWTDNTLSDWPKDDFRVFCGDLGNEVTDELLSNAFRHYRSFIRARVIRDKRTGKGKGYGFISFRSPEDMLRAIKEMDRKYVGKRPIRVMKSKWKDREVDSEKNHHGINLTVNFGAKKQRKYSKYASSKIDMIVSNDFSTVTGSKSQSNVAFWPYGNKI